jgi:hypothetical protein
MGKRKGEKEKGGEWETGKDGVMSKSSTGEPQSRQKTGTA